MYYHKKQYAERDRNKQWSSEETEMMLEIWADERYNLISKRCTIGISRSDSRGSCISACTALCRRREMREFGTLMVIR